jgi:hypothetical protein
MEQNWNKVDPPHIKIIIMSFGSILGEKLKIVQHC